MCLKTVFEQVLVYTGVTSRATKHRGMGLYIFTIRWEALVVKNCNQASQFLFHICC